MSLIFAILIVLGAVHFVRHHHGSSRRFGPRAAFRRRMHRRMRSRGVQKIADWIDADAGQTRALAEEADGLFDAAKALDPRGLRGVVASALRDDDFDKGAVEGAFDERSAAVEAFRARALGAIERLRGELDDEQRGELAALIEHGPHGRCCRRGEA